MTLSEYNEMRFGNSFFIPMNKAVRYYGSLVEALSQLDEQVRKAGVSDVVYIEFGGAIETKYFREVPENAYPFFLQSLGRV